jgi:hypothetical protein
MFPKLGNDWVENPKVTWFPWVYEESLCREFPATTWEILHDGIITQPGTPPTQRALTSHNSYITAPFTKVKGQIKGTAPE